MIGCAARAAEPRTVAVTRTPAERLQWLEAAVAQSEHITQVVGGAYLPRVTEGADIVCSLAIEIDAWYGVSDERWELTNASDVTEHVIEPMRPARSSKNIREELARIGIRNCVLDMNR